MAAADGTEQQLAWEARQRPRAAAVALAVAGLSLAGILWSALALRDLPRYELVPHEEEYALLHRALA